MIWPGVWWDTWHPDQSTHSLQYTRTHRRNVITWINNDSRYRYHPCKTGLWLDTASFSWNLAPGIGRIKPVISSQLETWYKKSEKIGEGSQLNGEETTYLVNQRYCMYSFNQPLGYVPIFVTSAWLPTSLTRIAFLAALHSRPIALTEEACTCGGEIQMNVFSLGLHSLLFAWSWTRKQFIHMPLVGLYAKVMLRLYTRTPLPSLEYTKWWKHHCGDTKQLPTSEKIPGLKICPPSKSLGTH